MPYIKLHVTYISLRKPFLENFSGFSTQSHFSLSSATNPRTMKALLRLISFLLVLIAVASSTDLKCYTPGKQENTGLLPCSPSSNTTACCSPGDICYSNGVCKAPPDNKQGVAGQLFINGCTDPDWAETDLCRSECANRKSKYHLTICAWNVGY